MAEEVDHGDGGDQLELGGMVGHRVGHGADLLKNFADLLVGNLLAVDLHALVEADNVWRRVQSGAVARLLKNRGQHRRGGALAVGSGDVDELQLLLRVADALHQLHGAAQSGQRVEPVPVDVVDVFQCFFDAHASHSFRIKLCLY